MIATAASPVSCSAIDSGSGTRQSEINTRAARATRAATASLAERSAESPQRRLSPMSAVRAESGTSSAAAMTAAPSFSP